MALNICVVCLFLLTIPLCFCRGDDCHSSDLRLVGGSADCEGRVEFCHNGDWSTICDNGWDDNDARVVCRQLGYSTEGATSYSGAHFGQGSGTIWLDRVNCTGDEYSLQECFISYNSYDYFDYEYYYSSNCVHSEDAGVRCWWENTATPGVCTPGDVRLTGGYGIYQGRVEFCHDNQWGSICDYHWDDDDARVVCQQLGLPYTGAKAYSKAYFGYGSGQIWLDDVKCGVNDNSLDDCEKKSVYDERIRYCHYGIRDAGVRCESSSTTGLNCSRAGEIRIVGTTSRISNDYAYGRVEICHDNQWGTICDNGWDDNDARVVCRQLGYPTEEVRAHFSAHFGHGSGQIWLDGIDCDGSEDTLTNCRKNTYGNHNCGHREDAGVSCGIVDPESSLYRHNKIHNEHSTITPFYSNCYNHGELRLDGDGSRGRVEICHKNQWGTVCDDDWDDDDARVVCRQLGYLTLGATAYSNHYYGIGWGPIWLDNVNCSGGEGSLASCPKNPYGYHNCDHDEDAGVSCETFMGHYGIIIKVLIGSVLLLICLSIIIICCVFICFILKLKCRRAIKITRIGNNLSMSKIKYQPLQQYPSEDVEFETPFSESDPLIPVETDQADQIEENVEIEEEADHHRDEAHSGGDAWV